MTEVKRGPGRPPKVRPEAKPEPVVEAAVHEWPKGLPQDIQKLPSADEAVSPLLTLSRAQPAGPRMIEVELIRKYAPEGQPQEIKRVVHPGTVMELPVAEATRALKLGIARGTDRTFGQ